MHRRFWLICSVIALGLLVLSGLGLWSLRVHRAGIEAERLQEFISVAEQIRFAVKKNWDTFLQTEQDRPYTDYQAYYVPETSNEVTALLPSPLNGAVDNGLAYGYFQLDPAGNISTPYVDTGRGGRPTREVAGYLDNVYVNLLPSLANGETVPVRRVALADRSGDDYQEGQYSFDSLWDRARRSNTEREAVADVKEDAVVQQKTASVSQKKVNTKSIGAKSGAANRRSRYPISNFDETQQIAKVQRQSRVTFENNITSNSAVSQQSGDPMMDMMMADSVQQRGRSERQSQQAFQTEEDAFQKERLDTDAVSQLEQKQEQQSQQASRPRQQAEADVGRDSEDAGLAMMDSFALGATPPGQQAASQRVQSSLPATDSQAGGRRGRSLVNGD